jgi:type VI secretion system secreted protein Hcp
MRKSSQILFFVALLVFAFTLSNPSVSYAKQDVPNTSITVTVNQLNCSTGGGAGTFAVSAFSFGASNTGTTSGGGGGAGKANISDLNVSKAFNECSPAIFGGIVTGKHFPSVKLVHADANGNPVLTIELQDVLISSYSIGGTAGPDVPIENVSFNFVKICITDSATNTKLCWDQAQQKTS